MTEERSIGVELAALANLIKNSPLRKNCENTKMLTCVQRWFVGYLYECGDREVFQSELEERFGIKRAAASSILCRMERDGVIERIPVNYDARLKCICLTEATKCRCGVIRRDIEKLEARMREDIEQNDMDTFFRVLDQIKHNLSPRES